VVIQRPQETAKTRGTLGQPQQNDQRADDSGAAMEDIMSIAIGLDGKALTEQQQAHLRNLVTKFGGQVEGNNITFDNPRLAGDFVSTAGESGYSFDMTKAAAEPKYTLTQEARERMKFTHREVKGGTLCGADGMRAWPEQKPTCADCRRMETEANAAAAKA